jgi:hypothetical protein
MFVKCKLLVDASRAVHISSADLYGNTAGSLSFISAFVSTKVLKGAAEGTLCFDKATL